MPILYDQLAATIIASVIALMMLGVQLRAQESAVQRTMMHVAKQQTLSFADVLERDFSNAGYRRNPQYDRRIVVYETDTFNNPSVETVSKIIFWGLVAGDRSRQIKYEAKKLGETARIDGKDLELLQVERAECQKDEPAGAPSDWTCPPGQWRQDGASTKTLTSFDVDLMAGRNDLLAKNSEDEPPPSLAERRDAMQKARGVRLRLSNAVSPRATSRMLTSLTQRQLYWKASLQPAGLRAPAASGSGV